MDYFYTCTSWCTAFHALVVREKIHMFVQKH